MNWLDKQLFQLFIATLGVFFLCTSPTLAVNWSPVGISWTKTQQFPDSSATITGIRLSAWSSTHKKLYGIDFGPIATNKVNNLYGGQFGLINVATRGVGIQAGILVSGVDPDFSGVQMSLLNYRGICEDNRGFIDDSKLLQIGFLNTMGFRFLADENCLYTGYQLGFINHGYISGLQMGIFNIISSGADPDSMQGAHKSLQLGFANGASKLNGIQFGYLLNGIGKSNGSIQVSLMANGVGEGMGLQLAFGNYAGEHGFKGAQVGVYNYAGKMSGLQLGVINISQQLNGLQIGVINAITNPQRTFPATAPVRVFPIINWSFG